MGSDRVQSVGVLTDGKTYGVPEGLIFSFPHTTTPGKLHMVKDLDMDDELTVNSMKKTTDELLDERSAVEHLLK